MVGRQMFTAGAGLEHSCGDKAYHAITGLKAVSGFKYT